MGSAIGAVLSYRQNKEGKKLLKQYAAKQEAAEAEAKALTPAEAKTADTEGVLAADAKRKRGVQSTFHTKTDTGIGD